LAGAQVDIWPKLPIGARMEGMPWDLTAVQGYARRQQMIHARMDGLLQDLAGAQVMHDESG
jgi:hypothetical protein